MTARGEAPTRPADAILRANFTISDRAKRAIKSIRRELEAEGRKPAVAMIGWSLFTPSSGERSEAVIVSFYMEDEYDQVRHGIQTVSGLDLIFFTTEQYRHHFDGKVLDHAADRGFFLTA